MSIRSAEVSIPVCYHCGSGALPFAVSLLDDSRWQHVCGAVVCPACGAQPQAGDHLCATCRSLVGMPQPGSLVLGAADVARSAAQRVARGKVRHGRR